MQEERIQVEMTEQERAEYLAFRERKSREKRAQANKENREAYRTLVGETVERLFPELERCSLLLSRAKEQVYRNFEELIKTKEELFEVSSHQRSHTFMGASGERRICLGYHRKDGWDDMVEGGIDKVKQYISSLARTPETSQLVSIILDLLSKDAQGNLQADKVLQLDRYAEESGNEEFVEGVRIIKESYRPERSKLFIRAEQKNAQGKWVIIPLGMTESDMSINPQASQE